MFRLRELRKSKKINQSILAEYMGVTQATLSAWETERYASDSKSLMRLADYFDCSTDYLLGRVDYPELVIKKAPPESGADVGNYAVNKGAPEFTAEEILRLKEFLQNQDNSSGE